MSIYAATLVIIYANDAAILHPNGAVDMEATGQLVCSIYARVSERFTSFELHAAEVDLRNLTEDELEAVCTKVGDQPMVLEQTQHVLAAIKAEVL